MIFFYYNVLEFKMQNIIVINNVLSNVINIQNTKNFEPVMLTGFYASILII